MTEEVPNAKHCDYASALNELPDHIEELMQKAPTLSADDLWLEYQSEIPGVSGGELANIRDSFIKNVNTYLFS